MPPISAFAAYKSTIGDKKKKPQQKKDKLKGTQKQNVQFKAAVKNKKRKSKEKQQNGHDGASEDLHYSSENEDTKIQANGGNSSISTPTNQQKEKHRKKAANVSVAAASLDFDAQMPPNAASTAKKSKKTQDNIATNGNSTKPRKEEKAEPTNVSSATKQNPKIIKSSSIVEGKTAFQWLINPTKMEDFFAKYWEKNCLLVKRQNPKLYQSLISFKAIDQMLLDNLVEFTKNIDVTSYENGVRQTLNPDGRAVPAVVWDFYNEGCSVRLLNPQTFLRPLHELCATLQEYFHCLVGVNAYLTPPNSQGFAPHYDDIEAFVLQIEGRKRWRLYKPRSVQEVLPRFSSPNFSQDEIGEPILEEVLEPGDILYFPRGTIHQACTEPGYHSLHITLSVYQKQSYADLLEKMLPHILTRAIASNVNLRRGLPLNIWRNAGIVHSESGTQERAEIEEHVEKVVSQCMQSFDLCKVMDAAVDELAIKFQHEALPPVISNDELPHTVFGVRNEVDKSGVCLNKCPINLRTNIRLLRANIIRLVCQEAQFRLYYYLDNSKEYCEYEPNFLEIEPEMGSSIEVLIRSYPEYIGVSQLPLDDDEAKLDLVTVMWKRGLLMIEKPIKN